MWHGPPYHIESADGEADAFRIYAEIEQEEFDIDVNNVNIICWRGFLQFASYPTLRPANHWHAVWVIEGAMPMIINNLNQGYTMFMPTHLLQTLFQTGFYLEYMPI